MRVITIARFTIVPHSLLTGILTYMLLWPEDGFLKKEDVRRVYDGSIFYELGGSKQRAGKGKAV